MDDRRVLSGSATTPRLGRPSGYFETTARSSELASLLNAYLLYQKIEQRSPRTIRDYRDELTAFISLLSGHEHSLKAEDVSPTDVLAYLAHLQDKDRAPATVNRAFGNIRAFFNWLVTQEFIGKTPTSKLKAPKEPKRIKPVLDDAHVDLILSLCPPSTLLGSRRRAMYTLLVTTGMRLGELSGLSMRDLDWEKSRIKVFGKGAKERVLPFEPDAQKAVWRYLQNRSDSQAALWVTQIGTAMTYGGVGSDLKRMFERAGLAETMKDAVHIFRRTWAMNALRDGIPIKYVQLVGGWESVSVLEGYVRALTSEHALEAFSQRSSRKNGH